MEDERVISYERGKQLADQLGLEFFETSAKENINVKVIICSSHVFCVYSIFHNTNPQGWSCKKKKKLLIFGFLLVRVSV